MDLCGYNISRGGNYQTVRYAELIEKLDFLEIKMVTKEDLKQKIEKARG